jgi:hypothetical protein
LAGGVTAPKERDEKAQDEILGRWAKMAKALKGRDVAPFQGFSVWATGSRGFTPGYLIAFLRKLG